MPIFSQNKPIIKIMDNAGNVVVDLTTKNEITEIVNSLPLIFSSDGNNLEDFAIYGNSGGVGDLNNETNKYDIPITIYSKNIIENNVETQTYNGITFTRNGDGSITLNGTATASFNIVLKSNSYTVGNYYAINKEKYIISGSPDDAEVNKYMMSYRYVNENNDPSSFARVTPGGVVIDNTDGSHNKIAPYISVWSGTVCNNVVFKPMLRFVGVDDTYEAPKSPITTTISVDAPLTASGKISKTDLGIDLATFNGVNVFTVGTSIKPRNVMVKGKTEFISSGSKNVYNVKYYNYDGTQLYDTETVVEDEDAKGYTGTPEKSSTAQYNYNFVGWNRDANSSFAQSDALSKVTADRNLYAAFVQATRSFNVYFYNESTLLETVENVLYGGSATYTGETPTKSGYDFTGWSPLPTNITADTSCYAQFEETVTYITDSWETISQRGIAGTAQNYYSVGDCKPIELNGTMGTLTLDHETVYVYILGFNHNSTYEPNGITFGGFKTNPTPDGKDICLIDSHYNSNDTTGLKWFNMNHRRGSSEYGHNYGGWKGCDMRYDILGSTDTAPSGYGAQATTSNVGYDASSTCATSPVANTLMSCLPSDLRAVMKPMTKYTDNVGNSSNTSGNVTASIDYLPLLAEYEIFGARSYANQYEKNKQAQYAYYADGNNSKVKYRHSSTGSTANWWERSPRYYNSNYFCYVHNSGSASDINARDSYGVAPIFLVGTAPTTYTVTYYSQDGQTLIHTETVTEGHDATYSTSPTKQSTAQYDYTFAGWNTSPNQTTATANITQNIQSDLNLYAAFSETVRTYTVYFYNESTLLETVQNVPYGGTATYSGATPTKQGYIFTDWSPSPTNITADTSCYAQFEEDELAETISDSWQEIINNIGNGTYSNKYSVGDTKLIDLGTEGRLLMQVVALDTDDLADNSGKAPITWISKQLLNTGHRMNPSHSSGTEGTGSLGGWEKTEMRSYLKETVKPLIPEIVRNAIKPVKKYTRIYNVSGSSVSNVLTTEDVWIPSYQEIFGNYSSESSGVYYSSAFPDNTSRIKSKAGSSAAWWWLRSASYSYSFYNVITGGSTGSYNADGAGGVALGFCT